MAVELTLYVMGNSARSMRAIRNLHAIVDQIGMDVELEIVDLVDSPGRADEDRVLATPTLVRRRPIPEQRIIGDLSMRDVVVRLLGQSESFA